MLRVFIAECGRKVDIFAYSFACTTIMNGCLPTYKALRIVLYNMVKQFVRKYGTVNYLRLDVTIMVESQHGCTVRPRQVELLTTSISKQIASRDKTEPNQFAKKLS